MRSPVLIAETPFAGGHGPRFLAPNGREVDADAASYYIGRVREVERRRGGRRGPASAPAPTTTRGGHSGAEILVLAGIDVDQCQHEPTRCSSNCESLEVLNDAVAAIDWSIRATNPSSRSPGGRMAQRPGMRAQVGPWADPERRSRRHAEEPPEATCPLPIRRQRAGVRSSASQYGSVFSGLTRSRSQK